MRAQVETLIDAPVLRLRRAGKPDLLIDLAQGGNVRIAAEEAQAIALAAVPRIIGATAAVVATELIVSDQWTVGRYPRDRPLYRLDLDDPARTIVYVSSTSGQIVLWTTATQRFWNWLGAIPHWIYPTALRSQVQLWSQIVIWASILGAFLTVIGIGLGVAQFRRGAERSLSPYRGLFYWHHLTGLIFGIVTLTWVVSGLFSMNPWGFLESRSRGEQSTLQGAAMRWHEVRTSLDAIRAQPAVADAVTLVSAPYAGRLHWLATRRDGNVVRLDAAGRAAPLSEADLGDAAQRLAGPDGIAAQAMLGGEDGYYFGHHEPVVLPVYRVIVNDAARTRYYLDPTSGALLRRVDADGRWHRWLFQGLHRFDFTAWLRARPAWDIIVLILMAGGVGLSATGFYLALRRIRRDLAGLVASIRAESSRELVAPRKFK